MASFSANGSRVTFSGLLIKFGRMKVGLLRITELFDSLRIKTVHQEKKGCGHIDLQSFKNTGVAQLPYRADSQTTLDKIFSSFATDKKEFINNDELLMLLCIIFMLDGPDSITSNEIVQSLTIFDQSFSCFDVSSDGTLQREELIAALETGGGSPVDLSSQKTKPGPAKKASKKKKMSGPASMLFDALDLDSSGEITFLEFLLGLRGIVMETEKDEDNEEESVHQKKAPTTSPSNPVDSPANEAEADVDATPA